MGDPTQDTETEPPTTHPAENTPEAKHVKAEALFAEVIGLMDMGIMKNPDMTVKELKVMAEQMKGPVVSQIAAKL